MFAILDDAGRYISLNIWFRRSLKEFQLSKPELTVQGVNMKRVALAILQRHPARIFPVESQGKRGIWLFIAVKVSEIECEAIRALGKTAKMTHGDAEKLIANPLPKHVLNHLSLKRLVT